MSTSICNIPPIYSILYYFCNNFITISHIFVTIQSVNSLAASITPSFPLV